MPCPHCAAATMAERAKRTALGYRTYRWQICQRTFNERTGTPFNYLEYPTDLVLLVALWRLRYKLSLRDLAEMFLPRDIFVHARGRPGPGGALRPVACRFSLSSRRDPRLKTGIAPATQAHGAGAAAGADGAAGAAITSFPRMRYDGPRR